MHFIFRSYFCNSHNISSIYHFTIYWRIFSQFGPRLVVQLFIWPSIHSTLTTLINSTSIVHTWYIHCIFVVHPWLIYRNSMVPRLNTSEASVWELYDNCICAHSSRKVSTDSHTQTPVPKSLNKFNHFSVKSFKYNNDTNHLYTYLNMLPSLWTVSTIS